jgi:uncharacterized protein
MDSISNRLKSLGVSLGSRDLTPRPPKIDSENWPVEKVISGFDHPTIYGSAYITYREFGPDYSHGKIHLHSMPGLKMLAEWGRTPNIPSLPLNQIAFLDTETSGLAGGTGTYAFMIGLGFFTDHSFKVVQFFMRDPSTETALLAALVEWMAPFRAVVTFNGKSFDIPLLRTRFTLNGISDPFSSLEHLDLLHLARRLWRNRLESRAMGDLEKEIIGFFREQDEVPGFLIPQYYFDYLRSGDSRPLAGVFYHNAFDIVSLAALFEHMAAILEKPHEASLPSLDIVAIARLYEEAGRLEEAAGLFEVSLGEGLPQQFYVNTLERFATLRRKQGRIDLAVGLWMKAAEQDDILAYVELAKIYEHTLKNIDVALNWSRQGNIKTHELKMPRYQVQFWEDEFIKRIRRLEAKSTRLANK